MPEPLHILLIMTDQFRVDHLGCDPRTRMATPNLDRLGASGVFTNCWSTNPICQPARASLLTGKYSHQIGMQTMSGDLDPRHPTYARALQGAGYRTAGIGKFHYFQGWDWFGRIPERHHLAAMHAEIQQFGFETVWEAAGKLLSPGNRCDWMALLEKNGAREEYLAHLKRCRGGDWTVKAHTLDQVQPWPLAESLQVDVATTERTLAELDAALADERPHFLLCSLCGPHQPYDPLPRHLAQFANDPCDEEFAGTGADLSDEVREHLRGLRRAYKAMVAGIDEQVGRLLTHLEKSGRLQNTLIIFTADHGEMLGDHAHLQKGMPWWQSAQVPCLIRHPGHLAGGPTEAPCDLTDITATILDAAGLDPQKVLASPVSWPSYHDRIPGRSLLPIIRGEATSGKAYAFSESDAKWHDAAGYQPWAWQLVADADWVYCRRYDHAAGPDETWQHEYLWSRRADPGQTHDVAEGNPDIVARFRNRRDYVMTTTPPAQLSWAPLSPRVKPS